MGNKPNTSEKAKPFTNGAPKDENTVRQALKFFGAMFLVAFMTFLVCSMTSFNNDILRIGINLVIESLIVIIFWNKGAELGTDGVARGEIVYQHLQKGQEVTEGEKKIPFHPAKGFLIGIVGSLLFFVCALILALTAKQQMTGAGGLPSWMDSYMRRSEISGALASYTQTDPMTVTDILRIIVRLLIMPFISMAGAENRGALLLAERLSPILVLVPAIAYGTGYLQGPARRKRVHTEIASNAKKRRIREKREKRSRITAAPKGPQQLN